MSRGSSLRPLPCSGGRPDLNRLAISSLRPKAADFWLEAPLYLLVFASDLTENRFAPFGPML